jgi:hypothetical protein
VNGKERVRRAMDHKQADRVPFFCQLSLGHYMVHTDFTPVDIWHSPEVFGNALITLAKRYAMDGILINLPGRPPDWKDHIVRTERKEGETYIYWDDGSYTRCPDNDNAHHISGRSVPAFKEVDPGSLYYIEPHNITGIKYPFFYDFGGLRPPGRGFFPDYVTRTLEHVVREAGEEYHISAEVFSPFTQLMELFGYSEALTALLTGAEKVEQMLGRLSYGTAELAVLHAGAGADAILVSSAFAGGGFISTEHYRRFVLPYERYVVEQVHARAGLPAYVHTCGSIGDRIDLMVEAGYDGVDTMDPPPLGNTDIAEVKKRFAAELFLKGNIDPVNVIRNGTPAEVYRKSVECIAAAGRYGGYILSSACSIAPEAPPENIRQMYQASIDHP